MIGTRIGSYEVVAKLGAGGMRARGCLAERVRESRRGAHGGGAPCAGKNVDSRAHAEVRRCS
jgi:hypothetical protein